MKKIALIAALGCSTLTALAQQPRNAQPYPFRDRALAAQPAAAADMAHGAPEGTSATPFYTETWNGGTNTTIPNGWTAAAFPGTTGTWVWRKVAGTTPFSIGVINSTTGGAPTAPNNNGWMIYNSDSLGALNASNLFGGTLTSPIINCAGRSTVQLSFQQWFRKYYDTCYVEVSNNGGGTYTRFSLAQNDALANTSAFANNPTITYVNISSVAANQANVRIRFTYVVNDPFGDGGYNWLIDDVALAELDPVELGVDNGTFLMRLGPNRGFTSFGQYPRQLVDSVYPVGFVTNFGSQAQPTANVQARIFRGAIQVYNQSIVHNTPVTAVDTEVNFTSRPGYLPTDTGLYTVTFTVNQTGDAVASNNTDTMQFRITDSVLSMNVGSRSSTWYVQRPSTHPSGLDFNQVGIWFEIPAGRSDTISAISAAVANGTSVGVSVQAQIYKAVGNTWEPRCETVVRTLSSGQISPATGQLTYFSMPIDLTSSQTLTVLDSGFYAAVLRGVNNDDDSTILIPSFQSPGRFVDPAFEYGTLDGSDNSPGSFVYGAASTGPFFLENSTPTVRPIFGRLQPTAVKDVRVATLGAAYPNPANTKVSIPVTLSEASEVTITLTNAQGQVLARQELGKQVAGRSFEISFPTGALASGLYFYSVEAAGTKSTGRIAVTH